MDRVKRLRTPGAHDKGAGRCPAHKPHISVRLYQDNLQTVIPRMDNGTQNRACEKTAAEGPGADDTRHLGKVRIPLSKPFHEDVQGARSVLAGKMATHDVRRSNGKGVTASIQHLPEQLKRIYRRKINIADITSRRMLRQAVGCTVYKPVSARCTHRRKGLARHSATTLRKETPHGHVEIEIRAVGKDYTKTYVGFAMHGLGNQCP